MPVGGGGSSCPDAGQVALAAHSAVEHRDLAHLSLSLCETARTMPSIARLSPSPRPRLPSSLRALTTLLSCRVRGSARAHASCACGASVGCIGHPWRDGGAGPTRGFLEVQVSRSVNRACRVQRTICARTRRVDPLAGQRFQCLRRATCATWTSILRSTPWQVNKAAIKQGRQRLRRQLPPV